MKLTNFLTVCVVVITLASCKKEVQYPVAPVLTFKDFVKYKDVSGADSLQLAVSFTDGDGDIGALPGSDNTSNLYAKYFEKINGTFTEIPLPVPFIYGIPYITPSGRNKNLSGDISVYLFANPLKVNDTIRYEIYITDRAGHQSNSVTSSELITNQQ